MAKSERKKSVVGERIDILRKRKSESVDQVAESIKVSKKSLDNYRYGDTPIPHDILLRLIKHFDNCDPGYILGLTDEINHNISDLHTITGMDSKPCSMLLDWLEKDELYATELSWLINNGLLDVLSDIDSLKFTLNVVRECYEELPEELQSIISSIIRWSKKKGYIPDDYMKELATWIDSQDTETLDICDNFLSDFRSYITEPYAGLLEIDDYLCPQPDVYGDDVFSEEQMLQDKKDFEEIYDPEEIAEMELRSIEMEKDFVFTKCVDLINYMRDLEQEKQTQMFWISQHFNGLVEKYVNDQVDKETTDTEGSDD